MTGWAHALQPSVAVETMRAQATTLMTDTIALYREGAEETGDRYTPTRVVLTPLGEFPALVQHDNTHMYRAQPAPSDQVVEAAIIKTVVSTPLAAGLWVRVIKCDTTPAMVGRWYRVEPGQLQTFAS